MPDRTATILVVDDNPATRYSTSRVLKAAGFVVIEAATGGEALAQAEKGPDLVVLDVNLPDMNGYDVCRMLRSRPDSARTPVVHLSATFVSDVDKVLGFEAGADGYITHPVEPPVLVATVNAFLRARHAEEAMRESEAKFRSIFDHAVWISTSSEACSPAGTGSPAQEDASSHATACFCRQVPGEIVSDRCPDHPSRRRVGWGAMDNEELARTARVRLACDRPAPPEQSTRAAHDGDGVRADPFCSGDPRTAAVGARGGGLREDETCRAGRLSRVAGGRQGRRQLGPRLRAVHPEWW